MKSAATKSKTVDKPARAAPPKDTPSPSAECGADRIAVAAYYRAQARGFAPGHELGDWLEAEAQFNQREGG